MGQHRMIISRTNFNKPLVTLFKLMWISHEVIRDLTRGFAVPLHLILIQYWES